MANNSSPATAGMLPAEFQKTGRTGFMVGGALFVVSLVGGFLSGGQFFHSYLIAYLLWLAIAVGSLGVLMMHHMTSGAWGFTIQRILEASVRTIPLMAILFIPIIVGMKYLYPWTNEAYAMSTHAVHAKAAYLNTPFFIMRAVFYFVVWTFLGFRVIALAAEQDRTGNPDILRKLRVTCGPGLVVFVFLATFAATDWMMSLEPEWFSTIFGFHFVVGQGLTTFAFSILILASLSQLPAFQGRLGKKVMLDVGNLMMAFTILWAYMSFSQLLIIWSGNLPEEIPYYLKRLNNGWGGIAIALVVLHFIVPFFLLLMRQSKFRIPAVRRIAILLLVMRAVDYFWLVTPAFFPKGFHLHWLDIVLPFGIGGLWYGYFVSRLATAPLLPQRDPRFDLSIVGTHGLEGHTPDTAKGVA